MARTPAANELTARRRAHLRHDYLVARRRESARDVMCHVMSARGTTAFGAGAGCVNNFLQSLSPSSFDRLCHRYVEHHLCVGHRATWRSGARGMSVDQCTIFAQISVCHRHDNRLYRLSASPKINLYIDGLSHRLAALGGRRHIKREDIATRSS